MFLCILLITTVIPTIRAENLTQIQKLLPSDGTTEFYFGHSVITKTVNVSGVNLKIDIQGGPGVKAVITNTGISDANNIPWHIHVKSGIIGHINKMINGSIDIPAGGSRIIRTGIFFGFGATSITIKVADKEQTAIGTQIFYLLLIKETTKNTPTRNLNENEAVTPPSHSTSSTTTRNINGNEPVAPPSNNISPINYTLMINIVGNGTVTLPSRSTYPRGTKVEITATPDTGWEFTGWSGDLSTHNNHISITMNADKTLISHFVQNITGKYTLTVNARSGGTTTPSGIHTYYSGTYVDCYANPKSGYHFTKWSGDYTGTDNPYRLTVKTDYEITANFEVNLPNSYTLKTTVVGAGCSVTKNPDQTLYLNGTIVTLTAVPALGWTFSFWSGGINNITTSATITINGNKTVTATFTQKKYTLTVTSDTDNGTVTKNPNTVYWLK